MPVPPGVRPLVLEDDEVAAHMCVAILEAAGHEVGFSIATKARAPATRRKIMGGEAKKPPFVVLGSADDVAPDVLVLGKAEQAPNGARLIIADACHPVATAHSFYALDQDVFSVPPTWLGSPAGADGAFDLYGGGSFFGRFALQNPKHVRSAIAALAACLEGFSVHVEQARTALTLITLP